jgi:hypothetical protein
LSESFNPRKRSLIPVVKERQALADGLAKYLNSLGLKRVAKDADTLESYINRTYGNQNNDGQPAEEPANDKDETERP